MKYNDISKILSSYNNIKAEIKRLEDEQKYYKELLSYDDLSELEYYKPSTYTGIKYVYMVYSEVEHKILEKEKVHKLNYQTIKQLLNKTITLLLENKNKIININNAINFLSNQNKFIIIKKFFEKLKYKEIVKEYTKKFNYFLSEQTIKLRVRKSLALIETKINKILFLA
jgi:hypothetical protein